MVLSETIITVSGISGVVALALIAKSSASAFVPKNARWQDRYTFIWLVFDALIHSIYEGTFVYYSTFGRTVNSSEGFVADIWKEYARADFRWGESDPTTVAIEIITVLGAGPLCFYILSLYPSNNPMRFFWITVLSTAELYGGWMTFVPEWLIGSPNLETSSFINKWFYLFFMNFIWVVIPLLLMVDAFGTIKKASIKGSLKKRN
ncbi:ebpl-prov protein [Coprinopsis marcescibilis]|uniref:Ebpl-prov protein n=1 Tax=Coprinopsis marcescibilis TaxID=230819 RepID=A0A5C3KT68_COPMA|nr:ebpl-prov protein [Coprinopsis marcescibilis]